MRAVILSLLEAFVKLISLISLKIAKIQHIMLLRALTI